MEGANESIDPVPDPDGHGLSVEDIVWHEKEILAPWTISTLTIKRNLTLLMNHTSKFGYDSDKSMNEMFRDVHTMNKPSNDSTIETRTNTRKRKSKWSMKEFPQFDGNPKNWVNWIKHTEAIMGQTEHNGVMESKTE